MASILDRYGIKEVADVVSMKFNNDGTPGAPVLSGHPERFLPLSTAEKHFCSWW